jgi:rSAM/selenodomain-associated transferase 1
VSRDRTVLVFARYPAPGRVKTRLAARVGAEQATELYRRWIGEVFSILQPLRPSTCVVCCYDGAPRKAFASWDHLADDWWPQPPGDLGERLTAGFRQALAAARPVVAVGTDCLELDAALIGTAFDLLQNRDVVFGPTADGGYYLVGMSADRTALFWGVRWSCQETLADHLARCEERGWSHSLLPARHDIDTWDDWLAYLARSGRH